MGKRRAALARLAKLDAPREEILYEAAQKWKQIIDH